MTPAKKKKRPRRRAASDIMGSLRELAQALKTGVPPGNRLGEGKLKTLAQTCRS